VIAKYNKIRQFKSKNIQKYQKLNAQNLLVGLVVVAE
jgi:hypothetical protein